MKILWLTNIPSPYRVEFFNELGKSCELTVLFEKQGSDERDNSWLNFKADSFKAVFLKGKSVGVAEAFCFEVCKYISKEYDRIVVADYSDPTGIMAIMKMKFKKIPYEIAGDGAFAGNGKGFKERIKKFLLSKADRYFSTAREHDKYYLTYGAKEEKIIRYPFTSLKSSDIIPSPVSEEKKILLRKKLDMKEEKVILSIGQFIHRKGFDILMQAASKMEKNTGVYIVGGTPTEEYLQMQRDLSLDNVHFVGFKLKEELSEYLEASDLFVLPTREDIWGLVINEAMAHGLPIITTDRCIAGLELVKPGENGYIVPTEDSESLYERITEILSDEALRFKMSQKSLDVIGDYTIEKMAEKHLKAWKEMQ